MKKLAKKIFRIVEFLSATLLFTLEIGCATDMANMVWDCISCFLEYPNIMSFLQLLFIFFVASMCGVTAFLSVIFILMAIGHA